jgi:ACS family hexuronate transporter-like MFS transporter
MSLSVSAPATPARTSTWTWWICGLLLLATMINYMDRLTLNLTAKRIKEELTLNNTQYGTIEFGFGIAFAVGAIFMGLVVDRWNVRWVYPIALLGWSAAGFVTGFASNLFQLMICRIALGAFEAGHWPCALRTTQRILPPAQRTMGNSLLQSGAAVGAIITPLIVLALVSGPGTWPRPFFAVGAAGTLWVLLWLGSVRREDLALEPQAKGSGTAFQEQLRGLFSVVRDRRFLVLAVVVIMINQTWHFFRVWLPLVLQDKHGYDEQFTFGFITAYYIATDAGSLAAGFATVWLARRGFTVHGSRMLVFAFCCLLTTQSFLVAYTPRGPLLLGLLLVVGFGSLGLFPVYYSLSQDLTTRHQGKLTGMLSFCTWVASAAMHPVVGSWVDRTKDWSSALALAGLPPLIALGALVFLWERKSIKSMDAYFDPIYGLSRRALAEWLNQNPALKENYARQEWLKDVGATSPNGPSRQEHLAGQ